MKKTRSTSAKPSQNRRQKPSPFGAKGKSAHAPRGPQAPVNPYGKANASVSPDVDSYDPPVARPSARPSARPGANSSSKPETRPSARSGAKTSANSDSRPSLKRGAKPFAKAAAKSAARPAVKKPAARPAAAPMDPNFAGARITRRAADRIREGHVWVYATDIEVIQIPEGTAPSLLPVADYRGLLLGTALYSPTSQIALRMVAREVIDETAWLDRLEERLRTSIRRRKPLLDEQNTACRLCFSEADELPGLIVDQYGDLVILQILSKGLDSDAVRQRCVKVLREELKPATIIERPDARVRELEGMSAPSLDPLWSAKKKAVTSTQFRLNGLLFHFDANSGQKTGAFLDQSANYAAAAQWAKRLGATGRTLDVCCYQGGFALHLARVAKQVTGVDASRSALEVADRNLAANRDVLGAEVEWVEGDAFEVLRGWSDAGERFDTIVLDPPAFAKSQRAIDSALRGYKELNLRALKMLNPGGLLVTCSCSHHVSLTDLEGTITSAAADANRRVRLLERRGAALDHPVVLGLAETEYLKCVMVEVE